MDNFSYEIEPKPISLAMQQELDQIEETENKQREHQARLAQKNLEEEKARLRAEQQQQIMKQEKNSAKLKVYFRSINLSFHKEEDDFNASMSTLSIFHTELAENFSHYAQVFNQQYERKENKLIVLQGFFHFLKMMKLASRTKEVLDMFETLMEVDGINMPVEDTLNIKNGLNYSMFLEALLRIGYMRSEKPELF